MGVDTIANELNRLYQFDVDKYVSECNKWKKLGYRIYRNSEGQHKVVEPPKNMYTQMFGSEFGNIFADIFGGM